MEIHIEEGQERHIRAVKGIFVGTDENGERVFATSNVSIQDIIVMIPQLVDYGMTRIAVDSMLGPKGDPVDFDDLLHNARSDADTQDPE